MNLSTPLVRLLLAGLVAAVSLPALAATPSSSATAKPGPTNSIVDVPGIEVGQYQRIGDGYLTGTTVVYAPNRAVAGVDVAGGAPGTRETDLLDPRNLVQHVNAIVLSGGSSYGLISAYGVMRWLREHEQGFRVGKQPGEVVPIVPGAIIFDLGRGGKFTATPTPEYGYKAIAAASGKTMRQGTVGAGTGARSGGMKGGVGTASVVLPDGYVVGAIVVVNSVGSAIDPRTCRFYAESLELGDEFHLRPGKVANCGKAAAAKKPARLEPKKMNTTIAVVATNAPMDKAMAKRMALMAQDGLAMSIRPIHTLFDGDTVFAMSTGQGEPLSVEKHPREVNRIYVAGADALARAVVQAIVHATPAAGIPSYCSTYPAVCP